MKTGHVGGGNGEVGGFMQIREDTTFIHSLVFIKGENMTLIIHFLKQSRPMVHFEDDEGLCSCLLHSYLHVL